MNGDGLSADVSAIRRTASWKRIRARICVHSMELDPDEHADMVWEMSHRQKWSAQQELEAELADTIEEAKRRDANTSYVKGTGRKKKEAAA